MDQDTRDTLHANDWLQGLEKAIRKGLFKDRYKILVLVTAETSESATRKSGTLAQCAELFHNYRMIVEPQCDYYWFLRFLSADAGGELLKRVLYGVKLRKRLQVITDLHQFFYNEKQSYSFLDGIIYEMTRMKTEVPLILLVRPQAFKWIKQVIGTQSVLYLTDGSYGEAEISTPDYNTFESGGNAETNIIERERRKVKTGPEAEPAHGRREDHAIEWYKRYPELLNFEVDRIGKSCAAFASPKVYFLTDRHAYWMFKYVYRDEKCTVLIVYNHNFPDADPDNITIIPLHPAGEQFKRLHRNVLDFRYSPEFGKEVVSIRVRRNEIPDGKGYAETAWNKFYSLLEYNNREIKRFYWPFF